MQPLRLGDRQSPREEALRVRRRDVTLKGVRNWIYESAREPSGRTTVRGGKVSNRGNWSVISNHGAFEPANT